MATTHDDDSFREIQLSGKQLVFLFMAATVLAVGIFLTGLMVGRGVLAAKGAPGAEGTVASGEAEPPPPPSSASPGTSTSPVTAGEKLSYAERLGASEPAKEQLKADSSPAPAEAPTPRAESPEPASAPAPAVAKSTPSSAAATPAATSAVPSEPAGAGFAIQLAAMREKDEADTIVRRLAGKGYSAYVVSPAKGAPPMYRVRVGKFKDRREADSVAARLQKEEQFKPWIVR